MIALETLLVDFSKLALVGAFLVVVLTVVRSVMRGHALVRRPGQLARLVAQPAALPLPGSGPAAGALSGEAGASAASVAQKLAPGAADKPAAESGKSALTMAEGESLSEFKARLKKSAPPKKSSISVEMLDTANNYDDKVALVRMLVAEDSGRVAVVLKNMIQRDLGK